MININPEDYIQGEFHGGIFYIKNPPCENPLLYEGRLEPLSEFVISYENICFFIFSNDKNYEKIKAIEIKGKPRVNPLNL